MHINSDKNKTECNDTKSIYCRYDLSNRFQHLAFAACTYTGKNEQNNHLYANTDTIKIPDKYAHHKYAYPTGATHTHEYADMRL